MLNYKNSVGWQFRWVDGSDMVEVYHDNASHSDQPVYAIPTNGFRREQATLKKMGNEDPVFSKGL